MDGVRRKNLLGKDSKSNLHGKSIPIDSLTQSGPSLNALHDAFPAAGETNCLKCGGVGFYRRDVPLGHKHFGEAFPCDCTLLLRQTQYMGKLGKISQLETLASKEFVTFITDPPGYDEKSCENLRDTYELCLNFARNPQGWLFLQGRHGCGKTHLAAAISHMLLRESVPVLFKPVPDLLDLLRSSFSPDTEITYDRIFSLVRDVSVLVLDDLGAQVSTQWAREKLYQLLNQRYVNQMPTVFTSNLAVWDFEDRLQSRLSDARVVSRIVIDAPDYRTQGGPPDQSLAAGPLSRIDTVFLHKDRSFRNFDVRSTDKVDSQNLQDARSKAQKFSAQPLSWLVLNGPHGCGKTHLAAAIANTWIEQKKSVLFLEFNVLEDFLRKTVQSNYQDRGVNAQSIPDLFDALKNMPYLVIDGYSYRASRTVQDSSERGGWVRSRIKSLLDYRYYAMHPTVITMCIRDNDLEEWMVSRTSQEYQKRATKVTVKQFNPTGSGRHRNTRSTY